MSKKTGFKKHLKINENQVITNITDESLKKYFIEINKYKGDETELYDKLLKKDAKAIDQLVLMNLKFVVSVAKKYLGNGLSLSDLINEGNIGLIEASHRFDPRHGVKFITFSVSYIRKYIIIAINEKGYSAPIPSNRAIELGKLKKDIESYEQNNDVQIDLNEALFVFEGLHNKTTIEVYFGMYNKSSKSLDDFICDDNENNLDSKVDLLVSDHEDDDIDLRLFKGKLRASIGKLNKEEKVLIDMICGNGLGIDYSETQIKNELNLSEKKFQEFKIRTFNKIKSELI